MEIAYSSEHILVYKNAHVDKKTKAKIVVSFSAWTSRDQGTPFGEKFFDAREIPALFLVQRSNHWWHSGSTFSALDAIRQIANDVGYGIVCYGSSMGAYGSLHFSGYLKADAAIAIAPQVFVNSTLVPEENRWKTERMRIQFLFEEADNLRKNSVPKYIFYDQHHKMDALHIKRMTEKNCLTDTTLFHVPHSNHEVARTLLKTWQFKDLIANAADGVIDTTDIHDICATAYLLDDKAFLNSVRRFDSTTILSEHKDRLLLLTKDNALSSLDFECLYFAAEALLKQGYRERAMVCSALSVHKYPWYPPPEYLILKHSNICKALYPQKA